jgi:UDP-N-acetylmuramoyl-tripeptide--D-alanyl-D-alanine ligase
VLLPGDPDQKQWLEPYLQLISPEVKTAWFGSMSAHGHKAHDIHYTPQGSSFKDDTGLKISLPLLGRHNVDNALAALAVARWMGVADAPLASALGFARGVAMRLEQSQIGSGDHTLTLINDAYNANPDSMRAALETLASLTVGPAGRRIAILGDMLELGDLSPQTHRELGQFITELEVRTLKETGRSAIDQVVLIGKLAMFAAGEIGRAWPDSRFTAMPVWDDQVPSRVAQLVQPGDIVLIKASRGMALERVIPAIESKMNAGSAA